MDKRRPLYPWYCNWYHNRIIDTITGITACNIPYTWHAGMPSDVAQIVAGCLRDVCRTLWGHASVVAIERLESASLTRPVLLSRLLLAIEIKVSKERQKMNKNETTHLFLSYTDAFVHISYNPDRTFNVWFLPEKGDNYKKEIDELIESYRDKHEKFDVVVYTMLDFKDSSLYPDYLDELGGK